MSAFFNFAEDNGTAIGSPARGTTRTTGVANVNWKSVDDVNTVYTSAPITAGQNSYEKFQFGVLTGSFNEIKSGIWQHTAGSLGDGMTLKGDVSTTYTTPSQTTNAALTSDMTTPGAIGTGYAVLFGTVGPNATGKAVASVGETISPWGNVVYTEYLISQLQTTTDAAPGDTSSLTFTFQWTEN